MEPIRSKEVTATSGGGELVDYVLARRGDTACRSEMRRGANPASEHFALQHVVPFVVDRKYLREPALLFAANASEFSNVSHKSNERFGSLIQRQVTADAVSESRAERALTLVQRQGLRVASSTLFVPILRTSNTNSFLDWYRLWDTFRLWDHPVRSTRRKIRQQILEDYFKAAGPPQR